MLELCRRGFETGDVEWNDISKGFHAEENTLRDENPHYDNELQMRVLVPLGPDHELARARNMMNETLLLRLRSRTFFTWKARSWMTGISRDGSPSLRRGTL
jgi:hypothetical protein